MRMRGAKSGKLTGLATKTIRMFGKTDRKAAAAFLCLALGMSLAGCKEYASSGELMAAAGAVSAEAGVELPMNIGDVPSAETISAVPERTKVPAITFEDVSDTVYVKTKEGGSVRIRSACDTTDDGNILTYASSGTALKRTGKSDRWSRIEYNGATAYIAAEFVTVEAPAAAETAAGPDSASASPAASASGTESASGRVSFNSQWKYAEYSKINSGAATLYRSQAADKKGITVAVNAGHGTKGGGSVKTQCHPDGTPKVTGGTTSAGATTAVAVSAGTTFKDGTAESKVTLAMAKILKEQLLAAGYDVLMLRDGEDVQLDNVARTVMANNTSDCHIALHWDSTENDKGAFYMSVPSDTSYRNMEPVKSHWQQHNALGESLISGLKSEGVKIFSKGSMEMDLTQTSYSAVPSMDIELGDRGSDHSEATLTVLAKGLVKGVNEYFEK